MRCATCDKTNCEHVSPVQKVQVEVETSKPQVIPTQNQEYVPGKRAVEAVSNAAPGKTVIREVIGQKGDRGEQGLPGKDSTVPGPRGERGIPGEAATIEIAEVVTAAPGEKVQVQNLGDSHKALLKFIIPAGKDGVSNVPGPRGERGLPGRDSTTPGPQGKAATIRVGSVITLPEGSQATVENVGTESDVILVFGIPVGATGAKGESIKGDKGDPGESIRGEQGPPGKDGVGIPGQRGVPGNIDAAVRNCEQLLQKEFAKFREELRAEFRDAKC